MLHSWSGGSCQIMCYGLNVYVPSTPPNSYIETLTFGVMAFRDGAFGR